jgi:hypothetical protein
MGIVNWRNAIVGWTAVKVGKRVVKSKAKSAVPGRKDGGRRLQLSALASGAAALAGGAWLLLRRKRSGRSEASE